MFLKKDSIYRAFMIYKNEKSLCLSSKVHDALKDADKDNIVEVLIELVGQGELITLKQLSYYMENLGLRLDLVSDLIDCDHDLWADYSEYYCDINTGEYIYMYKREHNLNEIRVSYTPYLVDSVLGWRDKHTVFVRVIPLRDYLLATQIVCTPITEVAQFAEIEADPFEDAVFECDVFYGDVEF